jgi:tetratricopeptide (TPR) repeat protein
MYYVKEKLYEKALERYLFSLECQKMNGKSWAQNDFEDKLPDVYLTIAEIMFFMNKESESLNYYVQLLNVDKYHEKGFKSMLKLFHEVPEEDTIAFLASLYDINREQDVKFLISVILETGMTKLIFTM